MKLTVLNTTGKNTTITVSDGVFAPTVNEALIAQAVRVYRSNQRQGTSKVKTRAEVARTKKKWFKQKGTGNARHGARTPNIFVGGGVSHGPNGTQNWALKMSRQMKKKALMSALTAQQENILVTTVLDDLKAKTKDAVAYLTKLAPVESRILIIVDKPSETLLRSTNNLQNVLVTSVRRLNIYELLLADKIIMNKDAVKALEARMIGTAETDRVEEEVVAEAVEKPVKKASKKN